MGAGRFGQAAAACLKEARAQPCSCSFRFGRSMLLLPALPKATRKVATTTIKGIKS